MAHTLTLKHGLKVGPDVLKEVMLREVTAGDIIDANEEAEKLVVTATGVELVPSPTLVGAHVLRRQIVRIGDVQGPLSLDELKRLHPEDYNRLQAEADKLEAAMEAEHAQKAVAQRGRDKGAGAPD